MFARTYFLAASGQSAYSAGGAGTGTGTCPRQVSAFVSMARVSWRSITSEGKAPLLV